MAYLDGQMSASEALEFERSLTPEDRVRIDSEVRLESAICESLSGSDCCPLALWKSLSDRMQHDTPRSGRWARLQRRVITVAAAAAIAVISAVGYQELNPDPTTRVAIGLEIEEDNVDEFARNTEVPGTREDTQRYLDENHTGLELVNFGMVNEAHSHTIKLLGACKGKCPKGSLIEVRLICCGKLIKLLIANEGTGGAESIRRAKRCGTVAESRLTNGVVTAVVGDAHGNASGILDMLKPSGSNVV